MSEANARFGPTPVHRLVIWRLAIGDGQCRMLGLQAANVTVTKTAHYQRL